MKTRILLAAASLAALPLLPASATWTVAASTAGGGSCTHVIEDGNWRIGVTRISDSNWRLGRTGNGSSLLAGSGVLDLRTIQADCGVAIKTSGNGSLENNSAITEVWFPDGFEAIDGCTFKKCTALTNVVFGTGIKGIGSEAFAWCTKLQTVEFADGQPRLTNLGQSAFRGDTALESPLDFSQSTFTEAPYYSLVDLRKVTEIRFPETLTTIGNEVLGYNQRSRVVWFYGPPPTSIGTSSLNSKGGSWVLVAGMKHAAEWKSNSNVIALTDAEKTTAANAAAALGLTGVKPIGKWTYQTGGYTHWVVEELPPETAILIR